MRPRPSPPPSARPGQVATLILPADVSWSDGGEPAPSVSPTVPRATDGRMIDEVAAILRGDEPAALFVGGRACRADALVDASRVANATGAKLLAETFPARLERGAGRVPVERLAYLAEFAAMQLDGLHHLVLVDAKSPVSFFAYPDKASDLVPEGCSVHVLAGPDGDPAAALAALAEAVGAPPDGATLQPRRPARAPHRPPHGRRGVPGHRRAAPRGSHRVRRGQHVGPLRGRATPPALPPTTGSASPAAPSARACPSPSAPRWPPPTAR